MHIFYVCISVFSNNRGLAKKPRELNKFENLVVPLTHNIVSKYTGWVSRFTDLKTSKLKHARAGVYKTLCSNSLPLTVNSHHVLFQRAITPKKIR